MTDTDEMGNPTKTVEIWYCEAACIPANMYPSILAAFSRESAEEAAKINRADAATWACVRVTGPHYYVRPAGDHIEYRGPRKAVAADLGLAS